MKQKIIIIEDDASFGKLLVGFLERNNFSVQLFTSGTQGRRAIASQGFDLLITDLKLPDDSGLDLLEYSKKVAPNSKTLLITGYAEVSTAVTAIKKGALDYISKPFRPEELLMVIKDAFTANEKPNDPISEKTNQEINDNTYVKGLSEVSKKFNEYLKLVGPTDICVLIQGESGTGKEVAAKKIHQYSTRSNEAFVAVDCGAIPKEIATSEFFGHVKGSFTGAINNKKGHFEAAHRGTLFLDEIGNLSYENQVQLLRALQEKKIKPVGSNNEIEVDVRIVTATNEDLIEAVSEGKFREDLYHRLNEFSIHIPSLRERKDDLILFTDYFLEQANGSLKKNIVGFTKEAQEAFRKYTWPGNLRELRNVIKRAVLLTQGSLIPLEVIPKEVVNERTPNTAKKSFSKETNEKQVILNALKEANYNKTQAAKLLQITRKTLYNKIDYYNLEL